MGKRYLLADGKMEESEVGNWLVRAEADAELAALQSKLAESEAQRAVLVGALGGFVGLVENNWKGMEGVFYDPMPTCEQLPEAYLALQNALASQPPSDLVALVKAAAMWREAHDRYMDEWSRRTHDGKAEAVHAAVAASIKAENALKAALDTLLTNQPGWRALIESEGV